MKPSARVRRVAAVLLVVFVLTTAWAAYYLYSEVHPSTGGSSPAIVATYSQTASNGFVAALTPSYLYNNSTEVAGGNITLFTPITNWINVTMDYLLSANRTSALSLTNTFTVVLSTPVWSKTLFLSVNTTQTPAATALGLTVAYDVNVSAVVDLANAINHQIGYDGAVYTLTLDPKIGGSVSVGASSATISDEPRMNFTFSGSIVTPAGLSFSSTGQVVSATSGAGPTELDGVIPVVALASSVGGLGGSIWVVSRRPEEKVVLPLDQLIAPYEEAIAETQTVLEKSSSIRVDDFSDLVKIADTLGKPILRPTPKDTGAPEFYVLDGDVAYEYLYPGPSSDGPRPRPPKGAVAPVEVPEGPMTATVLGRRLRRELYRLHDVPLDRSTAIIVRERTRLAIGLLRADDLDGADEEIRSLAHLIDQVTQPEDRGGLGLSGSPPREGS